MKIKIMLAALVALSGMFAGCGEADSGKPKVAFVTNGVDPFWDVAKAGAMAAAKEFDVELTVEMPHDGTPAVQKQIVEALLAKGVDGMSITPINPDNQAGLLDEIAKRSILITHDSDAPKSKRKYYVGVENYTAGRMCGKLVKQAIPDGGKVAIFVGRLEQLNAAQRRQGLIDELLDRSVDMERRDKNELIKNDKFTILPTNTDQFDKGKAKQQAQDTLATHDDIKCMVGLFAYNPPQIHAVLKEADRLGKVKIVGFDEDFATLEAIQKGEIVGTIVQNPYMYGYDSVRLLAHMIRGEKDKLPKDIFVNHPAREITKKNVDEFFKDLKDKLEAAKSKK
jgi:ribose transport system substrate-binding protein